MGIYLCIDLENISRKLQNAMSKNGSFSLFLKKDLFFIYLTDLVTERNRERDIEK